MISRELESCLNVAIEEANKRGHEYVTVEHVLFALLENEVIQEIVQACGGSVDKTKEDLDTFFVNKLETNILKKGETAKPTIGFQRVLQRAAQHVLSSGKNKIFIESVFVAIFSEKESYACFFLEKQEINRLDAISYISHGLEQRKGRQESKVETQQGKIPVEIQPLKQNPSPPKEDPKKEPKATRFLDQYAENLCEKARSGELDKVVGRDFEIERIVHILSRRRKNNPLLVGESGVGKTAIIEGLAHRIISKQVPEKLQSSEIYSLDLGNLLAGTKFRGDFENRLKSLIKELKKEPQSILFIDEIHTIMGAGAVSGSTMDAANLLKPFLASGEIRCIGSTTFKEYRQHFEVDHAMARRFQKIAVEEPSIKETIDILTGLKSYYEDFHKVSYSSEAIKCAVELSSKYIKDRQLPDKAIDVIDEVGAYFSLKQKSGSQKLSHVSQVDVKKVIAKMARIPLDQITSSDRKSLQNLALKLKEVVFGQDEAIYQVENAVKLARSGLGNDEKPIGSFLFSGPTGVGKTELAKQLAKIMGVAFVRFDMSEYMEKHSVSRLIGAPPGYVGYDEGGLLTDTIHKTPHCVLLLDEIEKAHPDIHNILLQVMDRGALTDANGRESDFRNTIIIFTTNVGAFELSKGSIGFTKALDTGKEKEALNRAFSPEFRNRLDSIIAFRSLAFEHIENIVLKFLDELKEKLKKKHITIEVTQDAVNYLAQKGYDPAYGARPLSRLINEKVKKPISAFIINNEIKKAQKVLVDVVDKEISVLKK